MRLSDSWAALSGWIGGAFLFGILLHSFWPYFAVPVSLLIVGAVASAYLFLSKKISIKVLGACLLALVLGVWRFDAVRSALPAGLTPLDPSGFARRVDRPDPFGPWRLVVTSRIQEALPGDRGALLSGMLYGERGLSFETKENFRDAGMLHLIAVSGSNVTLLVVIVMRLLLGLGFRRRHAFVVFSILLALFVLFVQPQASVVRAAIMGWLLEFAPIVGRIPKTSRLLLVAAVAFTLWQPWALLYDASFALSFLATAGLMTWGRRLDQALETRLPWKTLREILAATFGATLMTVPYSAWAFGQVSAVGLLTNLIAVPLVPWIMGSGVLVPLFPNFGLLHLPVKGFLDVVLWAGALPSRFPIGVWRDVSTSWVFMLGSYLTLLSIWMYVRPRKLVINRNDTKKSLFLSI